MSNKWSNKEIDILKKNIDKPIDELAGLLPSRSKSAIRAKKTVIKIKSTGKIRITRKKIMFAVGSLVYSIIMIYVGIDIENSSIEPKANVVFHPFIEDDKYLPIEITNGPKPLTNISLNVKTCYMTNFETFKVPDLIEGQTYPIHLTDENTVFALSKVFNSSDFVCNPKTASELKCYIQTYVVKGKLYAPPQECKQYRCGYCFYEIVFLSNEFSKNESGFFPGPVEKSTYRLLIEPTNPLNVTKEEMELFSPIGLSMYSPYDLCMLETNQDFERCKDLPLEFFYSEPFEVSASAKNKSLGNLSIIVTQVID